MDVTGLLRLNFWQGKVDFVDAVHIRTFYFYLCRIQAVS